MSGNPYPNDKYIAPFGNLPADYVAPTFSPLGAHRDVPCRIGQYGWVKSDAMGFAKLPEGLKDGTACIIRKITDEPREPRGNGLLLQLEDERGRIWHLRRHLFFLGYQFRLPGHHGWFWEHDPEIIAILRDEIGGKYDDHLEPYQIEAKQAIIDRNEALRWRGATITRR